MTTPLEATRTPLPVDELTKAFDALYAYDTGCVDSGTHDPQLKARCKQSLEYYANQPEPVGRLFISRLLRDMWLSDEALKQGYGYEDMLSFIKWLDTEMEFALL